MILSYSLIRDYINCPRKTHHLWVLRDIPKQDTVQMRWGNTVHENLEHAINDRKPMSEETRRYEPYVEAIRRTEKTVEAEVKLGATALGGRCDFFDKDNVAYRGKLDILIRHGHQAV